MTTNALRIILRNIAEILVGFWVLVFMWIFGSSHGLHRILVDIIDPKESEYWTME